MVLYPHNNKCEFLYVFFYKIDILLDNMKYDIQYNQKHVKNKKKDK